MTTVANHCSTDPISPTPWDVHQPVIAAGYVQILDANGDYLGSVILPADAIRLRDSVNRAADLEEENRLLKIELERQEREERKMRERYRALIELYEQLADRWAKAEVKVSQMEAGRAYREARQHGVAWIDRRQRSA